MAIVTINKDRKQKSKFRKKTLAKAASGYDSSDHEEEDELIGEEDLEVDLKADSDSDDIDLQADLPSKQDKFADALSKLLQTDGNSAEKPILSKKRHIEEEIDDAKLEQKARKLLTAEKRLLENKGRLIPDHSTTDYEKKLRKLATRGVVQLFNAIRAAQKSAAIAVSNTEAVSTLVPSKESLQQNAAMTKETFLKVLKDEGSLHKSRSESNKKPIIKEQNEAPVSWVRNDFGMTTAKHWDQDEDEDDELEF